MATPRSRPVLSESRRRRAMLRRSAKYSAHQTKQYYEPSLLNDTNSNNRIFHICSIIPVALEYHDATSIQH